MMDAGFYYVGDLCYVMTDAEWVEVCSIIITEDHGCKEGEFSLKDGRRFTIYNTRWGDGTYFDQYRNDYDVDSGSIGCIKVSDIKLTGPHLFDGGSTFNFAKPFETSYSDGKITIGKVVIDTDPEDDLEEDDY